MRKNFLSTPLVIATMAFAIVAFLFLIDTAIMPATSNQTANRTANKNGNDVACTMEAKNCPDGSAVGRSGPNCEFAECPNTSSNLFDFKTAKIGDKVGSMVITALGPFNPEVTDIVDNQKVVFTGEVKLTGKVSSISYDGSSSAGYYCMTEFDTASELLIPKISNDTRTPWFCFSNNDVASATLSGSVNKVSTVSINKYTIQLYPSEVYNVAEFVSAPTAGWKTYTNTTLGFSIRHPKEWVVDDTMTSNKVWFNPSGTENVDSIEVETATKTLDQLFDETDVGPGTKTRITLGGQPALRFDLAEFALTEIRCIYKGKLFSINTNGELKKDPTILSTFTFTD